MDARTIKAELGSILPYFGCKRTLAPEIVRVIGDHRAYFEPFCGSLAVLMAKPICRLEMANDLYGLVINLARVLADEDQAVELHGRIARSLMHADLVESAKDTINAAEPDDDSPSVELAYQLLVVSWQGRNGVVGSKSYNWSVARRYTNSGGHAATRWRRVADSIPTWHERLRHVVFDRMDGIAICERVEDAAGTAIYADPPYIIEGANYIHAFGDDDHRRLAEALNRFERTRVVLSYYDHPLLDELYCGWNKIELNARKNMAQASNTTGRIDAPEVLLVNETGQQELLFDDDGEGES